LQAHRQFLPTDYFLRGLDLVGQPAKPGRQNCDRRPWHPLFFRGDLIASGRLTLVVSKDFISFSVTCTSGSGAGRATADETAHNIKSETMIALRTESLLLAAQLRLKLG
jgi:hypothetical protein